MVTINAADAEQIEENAFSPLSLDRNGILCDNIINFPANQYNILLQTYLYADPEVYEPTWIDNLVYDAWGNHTTTYTSTGMDFAQINPFRYRGYYYDTETGLYYLQTRYYDPTIGQFINPDTVNYLEPTTIDGVNLYAYCLNNPVKYFDPTGHFPWIVLGLLVLPILFLDGDSRRESQIEIGDININGNNPQGKINVSIGSNSIQIEDSNLITNDEDMRKILEIIMNNEEYKALGYNRTLESYLSEWKAHNFAYYFWPFGEWGDRTKSVDFNKDITEDAFNWLYWFF